MINFYLPPINYYKHEYYEIFLTVTTNTKVDRKKQSLMHGEMIQRIKNIRPYKSSQLARCSYEEQ